MKRTHLETGVRRVRDARVALAGLLVLSMAANLALSVGLGLREGMTVLIPAVSGPAWEVGGSWAGRRYVEDAARLSHASARGAIGAWVAAEAERMRKRDLATAFYPRSIESEPGALIVEIGGELVTWIGREETSRETRRYRLAFRIDNGRLGLLRFEQLEE